MSNITNLLRQNYILKLKNDSIKMQPSITKFFKSKQPEKQAESEPNEPLENKDNSELGTPPKRDIGDSVKTSQTENSVKLSAENSVKRSAECEGDRTPSKRLAVSSGTPSKVKNDPEALLTPRKSEGVISSPNKKPISQDNKVMPCVSPLIDINVLIRKKISCGAFALHDNIGRSWFRALQGEFDKPYFKNLSKFVQHERSVKTVYPPENKVYTWTHHHDIKDTRVIILGQDPYHGPGQAHGLSFSVQKGVKIPPSLINIFKEIQDDISGFAAPSCGDLTGWAKQGVLMLNTCLSVNQGQANSHQNKGWETFTDAVISYISKNIKHKVVFMLWGRPAQRKSSMIDKRHKVLISSHPSPLSAYNGFFGCKHFSQTNSFLRQQDLPEIDWKAL